MMKGWDPTGSDNRRKGDALFKAFRQMDYRGEQSYLTAAKAAYEQALTSIEVTVSPETWMNLAVVNEYLGDVESCLKTCGR